MLTIKNSGKYLYQKYQSYRERGLRNLSALDPQDQEWADIEFPDGTGKTDDSTFQVRSRVTRQLFDIREVNPTI